MPLHPTYQWYRAESSGCASREIASLALAMTKKSRPLRLRSRWRTNRDRFVPRGDKKGDRFVPWARYHIPSFRAVLPSRADVSRTVYQAKRRGNLPVFRYRKFAIFELSQQGDRFACARDDEQIETASLALAMTNKSRPLRASRRRKKGPLRALSTIPYPVVVSRFAIMPWSVNVRLSGKTARQSACNLCMQGWRGIAKHPLWNLPYLRVNQHWT